MGYNFFKTDLNPPIWFEYFEISEFTNVDYSEFKSEILKCDLADLK